MGFHYAIFDMDGLMFDTEHLFIQSFLTAVAQETGVDFPEEKLKMMLGLNAASTKEIFPTLFGTKYSCEYCYEIGNRWISTYIAENGVPVKPGLHELLQYLRTHDYRIALATSSDREKAVRYTKQTEVYSFFDVILGGDMVTRGKPDPQTFLLAANALGCQDTSECVVFEDSANGLLAGVNANMSVIIVPDQLDPTERYPGLCYAKVPTLADAIDLLENAIY